MLTSSKKSKTRLFAMLLALVFAMSIPPAGVLAANVQEDSQMAEIAQKAEDGTDVDVKPETGALQDFSESMAQSDDSEKGSGEPVLEEAAHTITMVDVETQITLSVGELYTLDLSEVFTDSEGHTMRYTLSGGSFNSQVGITDAGIFKFTSPTAGSFTPKITAICTDDIRISTMLSLGVTVTAGDEDNENPAQYGYDETPASSVSVTVTISNDGIPLMGNDGAVLSHLTVNVPYFDLIEYGLADYYRYHTSGGKGPYVDASVVERPTTMHLFIYLLERCYLGIPEEQCGTGVSDLLNYSSTDDVFYFDGTKAYTPTRKALEYSGGATSAYMKNFWGHDENLMYYRNHLFPLMSPGWGATSDYMLLSDGDTIELAMFTNWSFYNSGAFCCFNQESYTVGAGVPLGFTTRASSANAFGSNVLSPITGLRVRIYDDAWRLLDELESETAGFEYVFNKPGTYHLMGVDANAGTSDATRAPATAVVTVTDSFSDYPFASIQTADGQLLPNIELKTDMPNTGRYHVSVPTGTEQAVITWRADAQIAEGYATYGLDGSGYTENAGTLAVTDNAVTVNPADWTEDGKALLLKDGDGNLLGAFTFAFYTPSGVNFAPTLAGGVSAVKSARVREKKPYTIDLSKVFSDPDKDAMTYEVSVNGGEFIAAEQNYSYTQEETGSAKLVFRATDSNGAVGTDTHTVNLTIFANRLPGYADAENTAKQDTVIERHLTELDLTAVFSDPDGDALSWEVSVNGGDFTKVKDEELRNWQRWILTDQSSGGGYYEQHYSYQLRPETGVTTLRFRPMDDLGRSEDVIYTWTVTATANHAPVPQQETFSREGMVRHPWMLTLTDIFSDADGDELSFTVSIDGGEAAAADANYIFGAEEEAGSHTLVFTATDTAGDSAAATVNLTIEEEVLHEVSVTDNVITPTTDGAITGVPTNKGTGYIDAFTVSDNVLVRSVRYSEFEDTYVYYVTLDGVGVPRDATLTTRLKKSGTETVLFAPKSDKWVLPTEDFSLQLTDGAGEFTGTFAWGGAYHWRVDRYCRFIFTMLEDENPTPEELLVTTEREPVLYEGQHPGVLGLDVRCRYSDGVVRKAHDITVSPQQITGTGEQTFTVGALGLTAETPVTVQKLPSWMGILNWMEDAQGGLSSVAVVDENDQPIEGAILRIGETVTNPNADGSFYDKPGGNRTNTAISVQLPDGTAENAVVKLRFDYFNLLQDANIYVTPSCMLSPNDAWNLRSPLLSTTLSGGKGSATAYYYTKIANWHKNENLYDQFDISYTIGANTLSGSVSAWDEKDNAVLLLYPASMSDADIRADVRGSREHVLDAAFELGAAVAAGKRYVRSFTASGVPEGDYKLAVYKPGRYVVAVSAVTVSGSTDAGSLTLWLLGDVNNDGKVNSTDAAQIRRYFSNKRSFTAEALLSADVNGDGKVNSTDAGQILRYTAGKKSVFDKIS